MSRSDKGDALLARSNCEGPTRLGTGYPRPEDARYSLKSNVDKRAKLAVQGDARTAVPGNNRRGYSTGSSYGLLDRGNPRVFHEIADQDVVYYPAGTSRIVLDYWPVGVES
jgi:hypothetical protein